MAAPKHAVNVRDYLVNTTGLADVSVGGLNSAPINQYAVIEYPGLPNVRTHGASANPGPPSLDEGNVQILARHITAQTALTNIHTVINALDGLRDTTVNSVVYLFIEMINNPRILERAEDGSITICCEFRVQSRR